MKSSKLLWLGGALTLSACQTIAPSQASDEQIPSEVNQLVQKRQTCLQLQLKYANEKAVTLKDAKFLQGCDNVTLAGEFRQLREKYQHNRAATDKLDGYAGFD